MEIDDYDHKCKPDEHPETVRLFKGYLDVAVRERHAKQQGREPDAYANVNHLGMMGIDMKAAPNKHQLL